METTTERPNTVGTISLETQQIEPPNDERQLVQQWQIENTPFMAIKMDGKFFISLGKYRITEPYETLEELIQEEEPQHLNWNRIVQVIYTIIESQTNKPN